MANNRMFLIHRPSKIGVMLGRRMAIGWHEGSTEKSLDDFYEHIQSTQELGSQDDFVLAMEDCEGSSCFDDWKYTGKQVNGFRLFEYDIEGDEYGAERAIEIARLWRAGKLIGADEDAVVEALLTEVERLMSEYGVVKSPNKQKTVYLDSHESLINPETGIVQLEPNTAYVFTKPL